MPRQFRSDDTSKWLEGFGNGEAGNATLSGTYGAGNGGWIGSVTGTSGSYSLTTPNGWANGYGGWICLIHQTRGTGAGNWELNRIVSISGTTSTMKYPLQNTYTSPAQCVLAYPYNDITVSGTLTAPAWNGSVGGIIFLLAKGTITITGTARVIGSTGNTGSTGYSQETTGGGYYGGRAKAPTGGGVGGQANAGEGAAGASTAQNGANGNGGGGAFTANASFSNQGGGGGGNGSAGQSGQNPEGSGTSGAAGGTAGAIALTTMVFGGGGGGGSADGGATHGAGGSGGGIVILLAPTITITGSVNTNGGNGGAGYTGGGGGAGGSILLKAVTATLGTTKITATGGRGGVTDHADGGNGGVGRIHLDYSGEYTGTTTPALDASLDPSIVDVSSNTGNFFAFM